MTMIKQTDKKLSPGMGIDPQATDPRPPFGNGQQSPEELAVQAAVQHHVTSYKNVCSERDELLRQRDRHEQQLTVDKIEIEALRAELAAERTRCASYQLESDDAIANIAVYQTLFIAFQGLLRTFGIEHAPLVKDAELKK